jgi:hypothetical protein
MFVDDDDDGEAQQQRLVQKQGLEKHEVIETKMQQPLYYYDDQRNTLSLGPGAVSKLVS